jgi:hypothetical protein
MDYSSKLVTATSRPEECPTSSKLRVKFNNAYTVKNR